MQRLHELDAEKQLYEEELENLENHIFREFRFQVQSEDAPNEKEQETVGFADDNAGEADGFKAVEDTVSSDIDTGNFQLASFLERPVRIANYSIPLGEGYNRRYLLPWKLFFNSTPIRSKLDNYAYIQADLHVKVVVNSSPFIYGMYGMSYRPLTNLSTQHDMDGYSNGTVRNIYTQRPTIYIESHKNKGGELVLPFFYHKNWLPLTDTDVSNMGQLTIYPLAPFRSANGLATSNPSVSVYAWATNVKLAGNTVNLAIQSKDEYGRGPVEKTASTIAGYASKLTSIPVIGDFAKATTIGASAVSKIANLFGWTNVPVIEDVVPFKQTPFHAFSSAHIGVPVDKLTLDPKNELSVDPKIANLPQIDELAIHHIASRPAFISTITWTQSDVSETSLFRVNVTPTICNTGSNFFVDTPMGHISRLFTHWRGDIKLRVAIVRSDYHQGRLKVTFDPVGDIFSTPDTETVANTKILDIAESDFVEFTIPYMAAQSYLQIRQTIVQDHMKLANPDDIYLADYCNGRVEIRVLNPLTGPATTSNVELVVWACCGDNFELANPSDEYVKSSVFQIQSEDEPWTKLTLGKSTPRPEGLNLVNFGEDIRSMRELMRRTTFSHVRSTLSNVTTTDPGTQIYYSVSENNIYPIQYGFDPNAVYNLNDVVGVSQSPGYYANPTPYTHMINCFVGQRGSMNYTVNPTGKGETMKHLSAHRYNRTITGDTTINFKVAVTANQAQNMEYFGTPITGMTLTNEEIQPSLQFSVPYMTQYKFSGTSPSERTTGDAEDGTHINNFRVVAYDVFQTQAGAEQHEVGTTLEYYYGIGADFQALWFLSTPLKWIYDTDASQL